MASESVLRASGDVAGHEDRRAELADGARERQQHPADDAARRQGQSDGEEHARVARAERARDLLEPRVDLLEGHARRADEQRETTSPSSPPRPRAR